MDLQLIVFDNLCFPKKFKINGVQADMLDLEGE